MRLTLRSMGWLVGLGALATQHLPSIGAVRATHDWGAIRMAPLAQAEIRSAPTEREDPALPPPSASDIRLLPQLPQALQMPSAEDPQIAAELRRLHARAGAVSPTERRRSQRAALATAAEAAWTLGLIHLHGAGVAQDPIAAQGWFERAHRLGHPRAAAGLAWCHIDGCGSPASPQAARAWIEALRQAMPAKAAHLEWLLEQQAAPMDTSTTRNAAHGMAQDLARRAPLERAAAAGDPLARNELGVQLAYAMQLEAALSQFRLAAADSPAARHNRAIVEDLLGLTTRTAPERSPASRLLAQAQRHHRGDGVPASYHEAIRLYREAQSQGSAEAGRMLALIAARPLPGGGLNVEWMRQLAWMDLSSSVPRAGGPMAGPLLQRDATPLWHWLPRVWQERVLSIRPR